ncbi:MAG: 4-alpha-glucanotransferase [Candidatus Omnitrophica bacterium]|nr:4-alpha-glucanotransferase [Candidatus Omnitrophota bacterium]
METGYVDMHGHFRCCSAEALLGVLRALGVPIRRASEAGGMAQERRREIRQRLVDPVALCWQGERGSLKLRASREHRGPEGRVELRLDLEEGPTRRWVVPLGWLREVPLPADLPAGYHRLTVCAGRRPWQVLVICAPRTCYPGTKGSGSSRKRGPGTLLKDWGVFLPLYALRWGGSRGAGDLSGLGRLVRWTARRGGGVVGTLPLFPCFLDRPFDPSPYAPVTRLLWGEFWVDVTAAPELAACPRARELLASSRFTREMAQLERAERVEYRRVMALKRRVLETLAEGLFERLPRRREQLERFLRGHPHVEPYARFRAAAEAAGPGGEERRALRFYLYAQWLAHQQMERAARMGRRLGVRIYLDLPLGVHPAGYDVRLHGDLFARGVSCGAPPDSFFTHGQDWGFPPQHPQRMREQGYRYVIDVLRHSMGAAGMLRVDHVMGLHRLFWVPRGFPAKEGLYVRYPAEELYGILALESRRNHCVVVGEDLGTVPPEVRPAMARHGVRRSFVLQYELRPDPRRPVAPIPPLSVASVNTHDMPPFASFLSGEDIARQERMGLLSRRAAARERRRRVGIRSALLQFLGGRGRRRSLYAVPSARYRQRGPIQLARFRPPLASVAEALQALLRLLARSPARTVLVNLEDLWGETRPQNVPGTRRAYPNWRRRATHALEGFARIPRLAEALEEIRRLRKNR